MTRARPVVAAVAVLLLAATACGQKKEAKEAGDGGVDDTSATTDGEGGSTPGTTHADSTVGITDDTIKIGLHAPMTGAGAPPEAFQDGYDLYWKALGAGVDGRSVEVVLEDDKYNPSGAVAACKKLVEQDEVFLIIGAAGADQLAACAQYADSVGVPYLSEGIAEEGFDFPTYFASTPTYGQQGRILAEYIANVLHQTDVLMVRANTANFEGAEAGMQKGAEDNGLNLDVITIPKDANSGEVQAAAVQICGKDPEVVYPLMSPAIFLQLASGVKSQNCTPRWAGIGNTMGINLVAQVACGQETLEGGASFFSSYPGLDTADDVDPAYNEAYRQFNGRDGDDIGWGLWAAMKGLNTLLDQAGPDLSRNRLIEFLDGNKFPSEISPGADFTESHFGGTGVHVLKVDCDADPPQWKSEFTFKSGFE